MKSPTTMFLIFSIGFAIIALFVPANDVQQGQAIGFSFLFAGLSWATNAGDKIARKRASHHKQKV